MQAPPPFPFWPLSPSAPKHILGTTFESRELRSLDAFQAALLARGQDYALVYRTDPAALLLDLSNASEHGLLRAVVNNWGVLFSLWKASDAYVESVGQRRKQLRELLKHLFFWADYHPGRREWPSNLTVRQNLLYREGGVTHVQQHVKRAETLAVRLALTLEKVTRELRIYSRTAKLAVRPTVQRVIKECEMALKEAEYLGRNPRRPKRPRGSKTPDMDDAHRADNVSVRLASTTEWALSFLKDAARMIKPVEAYRARYVIRECEATLMEILPEPVQEPFYVPVSTMLFDAALYGGRLFIGFWLIPLVLASNGQARIKVRQTA